MIELVTSSDKILASRKAVDAYYEAHEKLHSRGWYKGISEDHTPLLDVLLKALKESGFDSIETFFDASGLSNIQELQK